MPPWRRPPEICYTEPVRVEVPQGFQDRVALVGATASGKTAVGIHLAARLGDRDHLGRLDASLPAHGHRDGQADGRRAPPSRLPCRRHVAGPDQFWTLNDYQRLGDSVCQTLAARGQVPLIVGGTGLYVRALTTILDIPTAPPDEAFRAQWQEFAKTNGNAALLDLRRRH